MTTTFNCPCCPSGNLHLVTCIHNKYVVSKDESGQMVYQKELEQEQEEVLGYSCFDCGEYLKLHGEVVTDEEMLSTYFEEYGLTGS